MKYVFEENSQDKIVSALASVAELKSSAEAKKTIVFLDTLDKRLMKSSTALIQTGTEYELHDFDISKPVLKVTLRRKTAPKVWQDFPEGIFRETLKNIIDFRALVKLTEAELDTHSYSILDKAKKTVLRFSFEKLFITADDGAVKVIDRSLMLRPVKGYEDFKKKALAAIAENGVRKAADDRHGFQVLLNNLGLHISAVKPIEITSPEINTVDAVLEIHRYLFQKMQEHERGVLLDVDSECLHDFRVCVRKIRSALSQIKNVFDEECLKLYKDTFREIGRITNKTRDIDVYLLRKDYYLSIVPDALKPALDRFFSKIRTKGKLESKKLRCYLLSPEYARFKKEWELCLKLKNDCKGKNSAKPALLTARKYIRKSYKAVMLQGRSISPASKEDDLHELRIECKKLRYMMDFFAPLFPEKSIKTLTEQLKKLQDCLGEFNDLRVQQDSLFEKLHEVKNYKHEPINLAAAIGGLLTYIDIEKRKTRSAFTEIFKEFSSRKNELLFEKMLIGE